MQPRTKQDQLHFGYQKLCLPRNESASLKTKMFSTRQIVCHLPADFLAVKKEFSWLKNCCSSLSATCKSLWNFEQREKKKNGSTTPFFLVVSGDLSRKLCLCCKQSFLMEFHSNISLIFDKYPDRVIPSITTKLNILQKTLFHSICSKFIKFNMGSPKTSFAKCTNCLKTPQSRCL